jgi:GNAT superfamily N-acetyltransferase
MLNPVPVAASARLRVARPDEETAVRALIARSFRHLGRDAYSPASIEALLKNGAAGLDAQLLRDGTLWVAELEGRLVGCAGWTWRGPLYAMLPGTPGPMRRPGFEPALVRSVYVAPEHAGRGLGRRLLKHVEDEARAAGFTSAELHATLNAVPMYAHCGWRVVEATTLELADGWTVGGAAMWRLLTPARLAIV